MAHPVSLAQALVHAAVVHQCRREVLAAHAQAAAGTTLATAQGFVQWVARGTVLHGWVLALQGQGEAGLAEIRQGLATELATGSTLYQPYFLGLLAEAYGAGGHPDEGLAALAEALAVMDTTELRYYGAELYRLRGLAAAAGGAGCGAGGSLFLPGPRHRPSTAGQILRTPCRYQPGPPVAVPGHAPGGLRSAGAGVRVVHRGV